MSELPKYGIYFYAAIGVLVFSNLAVIVTIIRLGFKGAWWLSKLEARVEKNERDIGAAHKKIREIEVEGV